MLASLPIQHSNLGVLSQCMLHHQVHPVYFSLKPVYPGRSVQVDPVRWFQQRSDDHWF